MLENYLPTLNRIAAFGLIILAIGGSMFLLATIKIVLKDKGQADGSAQVQAFFIVLAAYSLLGRHIFSILGAFHFAVVTTAYYYGKDSLDDWIQRLYRMGKYKEIKL